MTKSNGIKSLKQAAKLLNKHAPDGESLAYINPEEARVLKARGGSGIMTLAGVPSYGLWDTIVDYGKKALKYAPKVMDFFGSPAHADEPRPYLTEGDIGIGQTPPYFPSSTYRNVHDTGAVTQTSGGGGSGNFLKDLAKGAWTGIKERYSDPKNIAGDLGKAWLTVESYKGQKDLNKFEQDKYDRALADIAAGEAEFASNIGASPLEITNMPSETDIASFTDVTLPSMTTTAVAEGGRIGFNEGTNFQTWLKNNNHPAVHDLSWEEYSALSKLFRSEHAPGEAEGGRIGYNMGGIDTPFQGIGALNPRMGYQDAGEVVEKTFSEGVPQQFPSDALGAINVNEEQIAIISDMNNKGMDTSLISTISGVDEDTVIRYIRTLNAQAHGGRIGYQEGTHPLDGVAIEMFGMTFENLNPLQQIVVTQSQHQAKGPEEYEEDPRSTMEIMRDEFGTTAEHQFEDEFGPWPFKKGGRIGAQKGGIMPLLNLGGMEKDYRQDGGFVPIGRKEKADDVPARLSKNEFVFTADAVRAAGGGDIDQGAQRMYNVMKNLEAGGQISQQSQGKR